MSLVNANNTEGHASMCRQFRYELCWRPENDLAPGARVQLRSQCLRAFLAWKFHRLEIDGGDVTFRWKSDPTTTELLAQRDRVLMMATLHYGARRGQPVRIRVDAIPSIDAGIDQVLSIWTIGPAHLARFTGAEPVPVKEEGSECTLRAHAGPVERFYAYCRPAPGPNGTIRAVLSPEDRFGNPSSFESPVEVELSWNGRTWQQPVVACTTIRLPAHTGVGRLKVSIPMAALSPSENVINGVRSGAVLKVMGNPVWNRPADGRVPAFGEFHWHTEISPDGQRSVAEAVDLARDHLNMDWVAPGDHWPCEEGWAQTVDVLQKCNKDHEFVTFFGFENGGLHGHENYYFLDPAHELTGGDEHLMFRGEPRDVVPQLSEKKDFFAVVHHSNAVAETHDPESDVPLWNAYAWTFPTSYHRLIELMQVRGNQERNDYTDAWRGWHQHHGASAQDALALGYKLGFTGGTDNHCGCPGRAYAECEHKGIHPFKSVILTGVWTDELTRTGVYNSLYSRYTWAVWDTRAIVRFTVNGMLGGGEIRMRAGESISAHIKLSAEDALQSMEIVSEGETVWIGTSGEPDVELDVDLGSASKSTHFYFRALQRNGGIIYASPVFVGVSE